MVCVSLFVAMEIVCSQESVPAMKVGLIWSVQQVRRKI